MNNSSIHARSLIFARRTEPFQESVIREMTRLGDETGSVNLSQGLPDYDSPPQVLEAAVAAVRGGDNQYTFPFGTPAFRAAIAARVQAYNRIKADPETDITVTCGVSEAMMSTILALTDPGDEVVILEPWYENYVPDCQMAGRYPRFVPLREPDYTFDPRELRAAFNDRTRLILINTPHNPTGRVFTRAELEMVARLCQEFGVIAVTDEIYEYIVYDGPRARQYRQPAGDGRPHGDHQRVGQNLRAHRLAGGLDGGASAHHRADPQSARLPDHLRAVAFSGGGDHCAGPAGRILSAGCARNIRPAAPSCLQALDAAGLAYRQPEGAYYVMADFAACAWDAQKYARPGWSPDRVFAEYIAREIGVAVVPGSSFYAGGGGETRVRFNFAKREDTLHEAARRLIHLNPGK